MTTSREGIPAAAHALAYSMFALEQQVPLDELHPHSTDRRLRAQGPRSPEWFAAAAADDASLLQTAPELLAMPADGLSVPTLPPDSDIIGIYAPESPRAERDAARFAPPPAEVAPAPEVPVQRQPIQLGLLRELDGLE